MKLGLIGAGNMSSAIMKGVIAAGVAKPEDITASDVLDRCIERAKTLGVNTTKDDLEVVRNSDYVVLAIKPVVLNEVLEQIKDHVKNKVVVSIVAGASIESIRSILGENAKVVRIMPNLCATVLEAMSALCKSDSVTDDEFSTVRGMFDSFGKTVVLPERLFAGVTAASGSGPAYVAIMIEAMADAAVLLGIPRHEAALLAVQTIYGSAKVAFDYLDAPSKIKDMVCSPGGTTIEAVHQLEMDGFRATIINAMKRCAEKAEKMV